MNLNERETATVLAALRQRQAALEADKDVEPDALEDVATNGGTLEALTAEEIDTLCERLNFAPADRTEKLAGLLGEALPIIEAVGLPESGEDPASFGPDAFKLFRRIRRALALVRKEVGR